MASFGEIAKEEFHYLESHFGYELVDAHEKSDGGEVKYINRRVGVGIRILYEFSSAFVFVFIYRLVNGEFHGNPLPIGKDTEINCFDFNDYLVGERKMKPAYEYGEHSAYYDPDNGLRNFTKDFAERLRTDGIQILRGDLSPMPLMAAIIRARAASFVTPEGDN